MSSLFYTDNIKANAMDQMQTQCQENPFLQSILCPYQSDVDILRKNLCSRSTELKAEVGCVFAVQILANQKFPNTYTENLCKTQIQNL